MKQKLLSFFMSMLLIGSAYAQERMISGRVTSLDDGGPLPGVTVLIVGTSEGTQTNLNGEYTISVPASANALEFSYIGFSTQTITIGGRTTINVVMTTDAQQLGEVVVTALGIVRKKNELPYAAQEVKAEEITQTRDNNFVNALSGRVAGLEIKQTGSMGGSTNVVMRGIRSMTGNNQALFVVDGAPISNANTNTTDQTTGRGGFDYGNAAADINPDDIASITVLKGAAATALYGSRAANGVIMITTKKGSKNTMNITVNSGVTFGKIDKETFTKYQNEYGAGYVNEFTVLANNGDLSKGYGSPDGNFWYRSTAFSGGQEVLMTPFTEDASYGARFNPNLMIYQWDAFDPTSPNYGKATPWVAAQHTPVDFYKTGVNSNHSLTISGGGENTTFKGGYTRNDETGVLPNSKIIKNIFNLGASHDITSTLRISGDANFTNISGLGRFGTGYDGANPNQQFRQWWQTNVDIKEQEAAYKRNRQNITWNWADETAQGPIYSDNPYFRRFENYQNDTRYRYFGHMNLSWAPLEWLDFLGRISYDGFNQFQEERIAQGSADVPEYLRRDRTFGETNIDLMANFNKQLTEDLNLAGLLGSNIRRSRLSAVSASTNGGLAFPGLYSLSNSKNPVSAPTEIFERIGVDGIFASANLGFKEIYFLDGTIRRDQSTTLPVENDTYWYPSVAASFLFSNLIENKSIINYGKLRLNYAQVGNDASPLSLRDTYIINDLFGDVQRTALPTDKQNSELRPERTNSWEGGIEMGFFNNRVSFDVSIYKTETFDQIMAVDVSSTTGFSRKFVNAGTLENKGVEVQLFGSPIQSGDFSWTMNLNFSKYTTRVTKLYQENDNLQLATMQGGVTLNAALGEKMGSFRGRNFVYKDGQKVVGSNGYYLRSGPGVVIGNISPDWIGGISNVFSYKNLALNFLIDIRQGGDIFSLDQYYGQATGLYPESAGNNDLGNPSRLPISQGGGVILPGVKEDGSPNTTRVENYDNSVTPYGYANNPTAVAIFDGSYVKLREASLTYSIPSDWLQGQKAFKGIDVSVIGRNLWLIHKNLPYSDPEAGLSSGNIQGYQSGAYPTVRSLGFNVRFRF